MSAVLVTGTEKSGSTFVAQAIARSLNIGGAETWNGTHSIIGIKDIVLHRSLPAGLNPPVFYNPIELIEKEGCGYSPKKIVITIRDINISEAARQLTWHKHTKQIQEETERAYQHILRTLQLRPQDTYLFSYETLWFLTDFYFNMLYDWLEINPDNRFYPIVWDGNRKYITTPI